MTKASDFFRADVGALIVNDRGKLLAFQRAKVSDAAWQRPQGGLETDESPIDAVLREVLEETGIPPQKLRLVAEAPYWLAYELPQPYRSAKTGRGQAQKWFQFRFVGQDEDIRPDGNEFIAWRWMDPHELLDLAVTFRRPVYERLFAMLVAPTQTAAGRERD